MSPRAQSQARDLKLPSIEESLARLARTEPWLKRPPGYQTCSNRISPQHVQIQPVQLMSEPESPCNSTGRAHVRRDFSAGRYRSSSPESDSRASLVDSGPSTASTSPYTGSSPRTSRSSSATLPSLSRELSIYDASTITPEQIELVYKHLTDILDVPPSERIAEPKTKHMMDERRRRGQHKELLKTQEDLCAAVLNHLRDPSIGVKGCIHPQFVEATMTGNHKRHNTKTAISLAQILQVLNQASRINRLESERSCMAQYVSELEHTLEDAGISPPSGNPSGSHSPLANKRRRSSLVVGGPQRSLDSLSDPSWSNPRPRQSQPFTQSHRR